MNYQEIQDQSNPPLCACGCEKSISRSKRFPHDWNTFIRGHINTPEKRKIQSEMMKENNPMFNSESAQKVSKSLEGHIVSKKTRGKIRISNTGKKRTPEIIEKIRISSTGKKQTEETKIKKSKFMIEYWKTHENPSKGMPSHYKGKHHTEDSKKKISDSMKGKSYEERFGEEKSKLIKEMRRQQMIKDCPSKHLEVRKKISYANKNRIVSNETRKKMSHRMKINNPSKRPEVNEKKSISLTDWEFYNKHGTFKSLYPYPKEFKKKLKNYIANRDNYICQLCNSIENGHKFSIHHIDYDKDNVSSENLVLLCKICHGKTNHNRNYWQPYFETHQQQRFLNGSS